MYIQKGIRYTYEELPSKRYCGFRLVCDICGGDCFVPAGENAIECARCSSTFTITERLNLETIDAVDDLADFAEED